MNKIKTLIAIGGTGGHVFPGCCLADHLNTSKYDVELVTDKRGYKFLKKYENIKIYTLPSSPFISKNIFTIFFSIIVILYSILRSLIFLIFNRPSIIFGMGGYASFPICIAATILRVRFIIYENNLIVGKANKYLLPFAKKIFVSSKYLEGISKKYENKICEIGNIIKKKFINLSEKNKANKASKENNRLNLLVLGGSQAAKVFAEILPSIFQKCIKKKIHLKVYQHCRPQQNKQLSLFYKNAKIDFEIFNFSDNLVEYFLRADLAITRSGSSMLAELSNANIPFISIPLPSSADNHQLKNAIYYEKKNFSFLIEEKDLNNKLFYLIKSIYENRHLLDKIKFNQRQFSDKNVFNNINKELNKIFNEKN
jgi:UDP-N-acetylglucosamine--N-acetylmuramyl-(pentapeptide) pyrophosphoryl-undecaprenol N-acetylglucosamine transferase